jgi:hypothetical protein
MRKFFIVVSLVGFILGSISGVAGAACTPPPTADGLRAASVVFVGTVESVSNDDRTAVFDVQWIWKGQAVEERVTVFGEAIDDATVSADDRRFQVGITYLVATTTAAAPYRSDRCTATRPWREPGSIIPPTYAEVFGDATPTTPIPVAVAEDSSSVLDSPFAPIGLGVVVAALLIFAIGRVFRGPEHVAGAGRKRRSRRGRESRLPSVGRVGEGKLSGGFRRSGVTQAKKLRTRRKAKGSRKRTKKAKTKVAKGTLRTDRLAPPDSDADVDDPRVNA